MVRDDRLIFFLNSISCIFSHLEYKVWHLKCCLKILPTHFFVFRTVGSSSLFLIPRLLRLIGTWPRTAVGSWLCKPAAHQAEALHFFMIVSYILNLAASAMCQLKLGEVKEDLAVSMH